MVWHLAWPTIVQNALGGLQGVVDHAMVGNFVGYNANAAIGVSWQIFLVVIVFMSSLFTGMAVLVARFAGANEPDKVNRVVYQATLATLFMGVCVLAPQATASPTLRTRQRDAGGQGRGAAVPADDVRLQHRDAALLHAGRGAAVGGRRADAVAAGHPDDGAQRRVQRRPDPRLRSGTGPGHPRRCDRHRVGEPDRLGDRRLVAAERPRRALPERCRAGPT
jgi:hypothetical protein